MNFLAGLVPRSLWLYVGALALAAVAFYATYAAGGSAADARWSARQADVAAAANRKLLAQAELGIQASTALHVALTTQAGTYDGLKRNFDELKKRVPLIVTRVVVRDGEAAAGPVAVGPDLAELSRAALWMWNSSLAGRDVPADSCGSADTSDAACAPASGATVESALANHEINSQACAVDRLRHEQLLAFLKRRAQSSSASSTSSSPQGVP